MSITPSRIHVLIIEDDLDQALSLKLALEMRPEVKFTTETAQTFENAVVRLERGGIDVVLLDLHLPDGEGPSLVERIKKVAPDVKVVVLTGWTDLKEEAEARGADAFMVKPAEAPELSKQLQWQVIYKTTEGYLDEIHQVLQNLGSEVKAVLADELPRK